jgi:hypothetical protein
MEENGLDIIRAYDTIYGFILGQEVHVRAELFQSLDVLYHWARKGSVAAPVVAKVSSSLSPTSDSVSSASGTIGLQETEENTARDG